MEEIKDLSQATVEEQPKPKKKKEKPVEVVQEKPVYKGTRI